MPNVEQMLNEMAESFRRKAPEHLSLVAQVNVEPGSDGWHIIVEPGRRVLVRRGAHSRPHFILSGTEETLRAIYEGRMTAPTAAAQARSSEPAPLSVVPGPDVRSTPEVRTHLLVFMQHFFNRSSPERVELGEEHARLVHGAHAIPLYYHQGLRSAWYLVKAGQRLNAPGDTNPFPQAFIFVSGAGFAKIGETTVPVRAGEAYFIPPGTDHVVWTAGDDPLELIFLAWGEGA